MKTPLPSRNDRILIIDDNAAIHEDFRKILGARSEAAADLEAMLADVFDEKPTKGVRTDFEMDSAYQGQEGLQMVEQALAEGRPYSLAFVDMRMPPGWDGVETITHVWAKDPAIQIVICTAYSDYSWQEIVSKLGNSDRLVILKKPFDSIEVLQLAHAMTKKWMVTLQANQKMEHLDSLVAAQTLELQQSNLSLQQEIAERELARQALRASEERLSRAFEACPFPVAIVRQQDHACVQVNAEFMRATGRNRAELMGHSPWSLGVGVEPKQLLVLMGRLAVGSPVLRHECVLTSVSGKESSALMWIEPFELASGPHLLLVVQDVSDQVRLENQLRHAQKVEAIGHLAAGVAHDMNNLLTVILGYSGLLLSRTDLDESVQDQLTDMQGAGQRAAALTRQLLAFSRKQVMQKRVISLSAVINNVEAMIRRLIPENIEFCVSHMTDQPPILADVCNIEQVLVNLCLNAKDAMPDGGRLSIETVCVEITAREVAAHADARAGHFIRLKVKDSGAGMDDETIGHIFEPFFTTKGVGKGTGMGLATVLGIVHQHEGWVQAKSTPGQGSTFEVLFPLCLEEEEVPVVRSVPNLTKKGHQTILLVEDDDKVRALARNVLTAAGYHVLEAQDGPIAVATWREHDGQIDLLLTDMVMPGGLSGKDVAERFKTDRPDGKIIYSSGYSIDLFGGDPCLEEGLNYLPKPYFAEQLTDAVARACGVREQLV